MSASQLFDDIARILASPISRRRALRLIFGGVAAAALGNLEAQRAWAEDELCLIDDNCPKGKVCVNGVCCPSERSCKDKSLCCPEDKVCRNNELCCAIDVVICAVQGQSVCCKKNEVCILVDPNDPSQGGQCVPESQSP